MARLKKVYKLKDEETTTTSLQVSGLEVETTYFFTVRGKNATLLSPYSEEYAILSELVSPDLMSCVDYTGDSFKARWRPVEGATSYLVSVYNLVVYNYTIMTNYLLRQEETTDTCMTVTGCDPSLTYYYIVQSKGAGVSAESGYAMPAVPQLTAPLPLEPTNITSNSFTANWEEVLYSQGYTPFLYKEHTALADEKLSIIDTDNEPVNLYDVKGALLLSVPAGESEGVYDLPGAGLYIVKVGNHAIKVVR